MTLHVIYTIKCDYEFNEEELRRDYPEEENLIAFAEGWIEENFARITTRADNVLPFDYKIDIQFIKKEVNSKNE